LEFGGPSCGLLIGLLDAAGYGCAVAFDYAVGELVDELGWSILFILVFIAGVGSVASLCTFLAIDAHQATNVSR